EPDVVLMDLSMPGVDGIEATRQIVEGQPGSKVVVLTSFCDRERIFAALDAGAVGYLLKDADPEELLRGIRAAARGESPLAAKVASARIPRTLPGCPPSPAGTVTSPDGDSGSALYRFLGRRSTARGRDHRRAESPCVGVVGRRVGLGHHRPAGRTRRLVPPGIGRLAV